MSRYAPVATTDHDDHLESQYSEYEIPNSPPPSFRSRSPSPRESAADRELNDTFDSPSDDEDEDEDGHGHGEGQGDRQRLIHSSSASERAHPQTSPTNESRPVERRVTQLPVFAPSTIYGGGGGNDGVFANLSAKPTRGEEMDEKPPVRMPDDIDL
jgi:hypothetical protein